MLLPSVLYQPINFSSDVKPYEKPHHSYTKPVAHPEISEDVMTSDEELLEIITPSVEFVQYPHVVSEEITTLRKDQPSMITPSVRAQHVVKKGVQLSDANKKLLEAASILGVPLRVTSGIRPEAITKSGKPSRHASGDAIDITPIPGQTWDDLRNLIKTSGFGEWLRKNGYKVIEEITPEDQKKYGASGPNIHIGKYKIRKSMLGSKIYPTFYRCLNDICR